MRVTKNYHSVFIGPGTRDTFLNLSTVEINFYPFSRDVHVNYWEIIR